MPALASDNAALRREEGGGGGRRKQDAITQVCREKGSGPNPEFIQVPPYLGRLPRYLPRERRVTVVKLQQRTYLPTYLSSVSTSG